MKNKIFELMMDLQLFAEGDGTGAGDPGNGAGNPGGEGPGGSEGKEGGDPKPNNTGSFDDFLSNPENQAEFDRRVAKALNKQKEKLDSDRISSMIDSMSGWKK